MKDNNIQTRVRDNAAFVTWGDDDISRGVAMGHLSDALDSFVGISKTAPYDKTSRRASGGYYQDLSDLASNTSGRPGLSRSDYERFRPDEAIPKKFPEILRAADDAYTRVGLIRNIIDLMGDFASQGVRIVHPNKKIQKFYRNWFKRVDGKERSERFLNNLYRTGNVIIRRQTAKINKKNETTLYKAKGKPDLKLVPEKWDNLEKKEIPWKYTFINPCTVKVAGGALASFVNERIYTIQLSGDIAQTIRYPKTDEEKKIVSQLPQDIINAAKSNQPYVLDPAKTSVFHYKKDDWRPWAFPMIYSILDDIGIVEKLKLADVAALDGAISNVRIWKLGSLEHKIAPTRIAAAKLAEILENNVGGGTMDLIWGPDIELIETNNNVYKFLGEEKYRPHLNNIYTGLGIPPTLTGTFGTSGTTNNYISLKTLIQRLEYGRDRLIEFWSRELAIIQKAMNFKLPATIEFDISNLGDETAEKALLIQLADRQLISDELLQERYGSDPIMEKVRIAREQRERNQGQRPSKAGPYHKAQYGHEFKKMFLQKGEVTPGQLGLNKNAKHEHMRLYDKPNDETPAAERREKLQEQQIQQRGNPVETKESGIPQQGRPKNSPDTVQRKEKEFKPKKKAALAIWARNAQAYIAHELNPLILDKYNRKNLRSLSSKETMTSENIKFSVLCALEPFAELKIDTILAALQDDKQFNTMQSFYDQFVNDVRAEVGRELTFGEIRDLQVDFYIKEILNG